MGILSGNPKDEPLHYGEVYSTWSYLLAGKGMTSAYQTMLSHSGDGDLKKMLEEAIRLCKQEEEHIEAMLKENGIGLPPAPPDRPDACVNDIPPGARFMDPEVAAKLSGDLAAGLVGCSTIMGQCIREDIAGMFGQFHTQKAALGVKVLRMNKEKGWLIPPPLHLHKSDNC
ncbi:DUF3231 family protein [Cytobacillus pseudoceanisediminis]|uniref:DUF3231 family protein n=1 Tax=Cytobacillus pseudoceanisediminis TaxID=3051614 RepID=UPI00364E3DD4